jgi:hypothetical protein
MTFSAFVFSLLTSFVINPAHAGEQALHAHEHGSIKVEMAVDKNTVEINIDGPAESFLGFEYKAKTAQEKKHLADLEKTWTKKLETYIAFDKKLNCLVNEASFKQVIEEGTHSDIEAKAKLTCAAHLTGSEVVISLKKTFKSIKKLSVEVISTQVLSVEITKDVQSFKI